ncbi:MAG: FAD-dependent oxidoreductase [Ferruginibacter sp.]
MKKINTLIVGQGIAGSLVAFMLHLRNMPFVVIDPALANTSSRIAAGMFTPVSGKRKTINLHTLNQIPFAIQIYQELEKLLDARLLHLQNIHQVYHSVAERNELTSKLNNADFAKFIITDPLSLQGIKEPIGAFGISHSGWVDCPAFIEAFANWLKQQDALVEGLFAYGELQITKDKMAYRGMEFNNIIFCEGYKAVGNPFFESENIIPCKGDLLTIKYDHLSTDLIVKKNGIYLIPSGNNTFRAGSTYQWNDDSESANEEARKLIERQLDSMLDNNYTTIGHSSGIRPTTKTREVVARQHTENKGMFMLNGLGTKGVLQGPWWAKHITELCCNNNE